MLPAACVASTAVFLGGLWHLSATVSTGNGELHEGTPAARMHAQAHAVAALAAHAPAAPHAMAHAQLAIYCRAGRTPEQLCEHALSRFNLKIKPNFEVHAAALCAWPLAFCWLASATYMYWPRPPRLSPRLPLAVSCCPCWPPTLAPAPPPTTAPQVVPLASADLLLPERYPRFTMLAQAWASVRVSCTLSPAARERYQPTAACWLVQAHVHHRGTCWASVCRTTQGSSPLQPHSLRLTSQYALTHAAGGAGRAAGAGAGRVL